MSSWDAADLEFDAATFSGVVRLFPLPNLVLYPHVIQPLHVFEGRYREMVEDAMDDDGLIAMAVLEPGWEPDYESRPPVAPHACLGKILTHCRLEDGRYNLLLLGARRVRITRELDPLRSFRQAEVELIEDHYDHLPVNVNELQDKLLAEFRQYLPCECLGSDQLDELISGKLPLGALTDLAAYTLPLDLAVKQKMLGECRVETRAQMLLDQFRTVLNQSETGASAKGFPPPFSKN